VKSGKTPKKEKLPKSEILFLSRQKGEDNITAIVASDRPLSQKEIEKRVAVFLAVAQYVKCEKCGYTYDGTRYFAVSYENRDGLMSHIVRAVCGKCLPEIKYAVEIAEATLIKEEGHE